MTVKSGEVQLRLVQSYLDDVEKEVVELPSDYWSHAQLPGEFIGRKESYIEQIVKGRLQDLKEAIVEAKALGIENVKLARIEERAFFLEGRLWHAKGCSWLGIPYQFVGQDQDSEAVGNRKARLSQAEECYGLAISLADTKPMMATAHLAEVLAHQDRFDESLAVWQSIIDIAPQSDLALEALKAQNDIRRTREVREAEIAEYHRCKAEYSQTAKSTAGGCGILFVLIAVIPLVPLCLWLASFC